MFSNEKENIVYCIWLTSYSDTIKNPMWEEERFYGWMLRKNGNTVSVFSAASVLNSLAYLRFCSETVTHSRELHLALVMGFNRKCGVTSEMGMGRRAGGGRVGDLCTKGTMTAAGCR